MSPALVDTYVVLDALLDRPPFAPVAGLILAKVAAEELRASLTATTLTTIFHVARKVVGTEQARRDIAALLATFEVAPVNHAILRAALDRRWADFEDAAAVAAGIGTIVTRDPPGFAGSSLEILDPAGLVAGLAGGP